MRKLLILLLLTSFAISQSAKVYWVANEPDSRVTASEAQALDTFADAIDEISANEADALMVLADGLEGVDAAGALRLLAISDQGDASFDSLTITDVITIDGGVAHGIDFQGAYSDAAIDLTDIVLNHSGSSGPVMIRAGTYGSPVTSSDPHQSGMIRLYSRNSALTDDGTGFYDRGIFVSMKTTGAKSIFPIAGLAEVEATVSGNGPTSVMASQFIAQLLETGSKLANTTGVNGMYGGWFKITAIDGSTTGATSKKAAVWLDNQMYGNNAAPGEEYTIFATTGGLRPDAFVGFETSSSGWDYMWYFDETAYNKAPISTMTPATGSQDADGSIIINLNGTAYYIPYYGIGKD